MEKYYIAGLLYIIFIIIIIILDLFHRMELPDPNYICKFSLG